MSEQKPMMHAKAVWLAVTTVFVGYAGCSAVVRGLTGSYDNVAAVYLTIGFFILWMLVGMSNRRWL